MKKLLTTLSFILALTLSNLSAQPGFDDDVTDTPRDGGISILLIAGAGYGLSKISRQREKN